MTVFLFQAIGCFAFAEIGCTRGCYAPLFLPKAGAIIVTCTSSANWHVAGLIANGLSRVGTIFVLGTLRSDTSTRIRNGSVSAPNFIMELISTLVVTHATRLTNTNK